MKIISFLNHKGGVGKTTLCTNLAKAIILEDDATVTLVDADPQGSLRDWQNAKSEGENHEGLDIVGADRRNTLMGVRNLFSSNYMLIDTPGNIKDLHAAALNMSDMVIIPLRPSPYDVWATEDTIELVRTARDINPKIKAAILINQAIPNTKIHAEVTELLKKFEDFYIVQCAISHRVSFAKMAAIGNTVFESGDSSAIREVQIAANHILNNLYEHTSI